MFERDGSGVGKVTNRRGKVIGDHQNVRVRSLVLALRNASLRRWRSSWELGELS